MQQRDTKVMTNEELLRELRILEGKGATLSLSEGGRIDGIRAELVRRAKESQKAKE